VDADTGCLGAVVSAGEATINLTISNDAFTCDDGTLAGGTGAFDRRAGNRFGLHDGLGFANMIVHMNLGDGKGEAKTKSH
jgi:hypothetical protein